MRVAAVYLIAALIAVPMPAVASDCGDAVDRYNSVLADVSSALRRYSNCVSASRGRDDCSTEFRRLKYAQDDLESAVSEIGSYCRD